MKTMTRYGCLVLCLLMISGQSFAQEEASRFTFGVQHRLRFTSFNNALDMDSDLDNQNTYTRHRTNLWVRWASNFDLEIFVMLTNEFRNYFRPEGRDFNIHEIFFDNVYFLWKYPAGIPLLLTVGRQNIMLGEGFVVMDAHPQDGSRSIYFNALRADIMLGEERKLTFFYAYQPTTDRTFPVFNDQDQAMIEQPEEGIGVYYSGKHGRSRFDGYYIRKNIEAANGRPIASAINTFGWRGVIPLSERLSATTELNYQFGSYGDFGRSALGGIFHLDYSLKRPGLLPRTLTLGSIFLTGDDPSTDAMEAWDPLFSRWPKWSFSYLYALIQEQGGKVGYWSNFASVYGALGYRFWDRIDLSVTAHRLFAPRLAVGAAYLSGDGHTRGTLVVTKLSFGIAKCLKGHMMWDVFAPGDFYFEGADGLHYFHCQLVATLPSP